MEGTHEARIGLVPYAGGPLRREVCRSLGALGYEVFELDPQRLPEATSGSADTVLLVGSAEVGGGKLEALFERLRRPPLLAVLTAEAAFGPRLLFERCLDFVIWPCGHEELGLRLERLGRLPSPPSLSDEGLVREFEALHLIGRSPAFLRILRMIKRMCDLSVPVLIEGATGTGKELVARALHYLGPRRGFPFVPVNCGALPENLLENEFFGHDRGAYTDARGPQVGLVEQAHRGTLFLDEVEALPPRGQVALLRFLQDFEFRPLGSRQTRKVDLRLIAATNADLRSLVANGRFRQDLFFRLDLLVLSLPPLAEREGDVELLARHFVRQYAKQHDADVHLHPLTVAAMCSYPWPGNVRELEHFVHRLVVLARGPLLLGDPRPAEGGGREPDAEMEELSFSEAKARLIEKFEKGYLDGLMWRVRGNVTAAARRAGKERRAMGKLLKKHGIDRERYLRTH